MAQLQEVVSKESQEVKESVNESIKEEVKVVIKEVEKPCTKCLKSCKECSEKDLKLKELKIYTDNLKNDLSETKIAYDKLSKSIKQFQQVSKEDMAIKSKLKATVVDK